MGQEEEFGENELYENRMSNRGWMKRMDKG